MLSACEPDLVDGRLCLGMVWMSRKAIDLRCDSRIVVHSVPSDRLDSGGDVRHTYGSATTRSPVTGARGADSAISIVPTSAADRATAASANRRSDGTPHRPSGPRRGGIDR